MNIQEFKGLGNLIFQTLLIISTNKKPQLEKLREVEDVFVLIVMRPIEKKVTRDQNDS